MSKRDGKEQSAPQGGRSESERRGRARRKLLKSLAAGGGVVVATKVIPTQWSKPVIDSLLLPAHANASGGLVAQLEIIKGTDDEADDVRAFLDEHGIAWYETAPGFWNISLAGIWIREDSAFLEAKRLMAEYQAQRGARVRAENEAARRDGTAETFGTVLRTGPADVVVYDVLRAEWESGRPSR